MRLLKSLLSVLTARWFWTLIGCLILAALIWFLGDLLAFGEWRPFASDTAKLLGILVVALIWGISNLFSQLRARQRNSGLVAELAAPAARADPSDAEVAELARRFTAALDQLKRRRVGGKGGRRWLYELPWYVMIGPPGSGKTTALVQSGLRFPLGNTSELRGVGGTRYCDWFFTDEAVLIDTAGRYTSQDSHQEVDARAWKGFLALLRRRRPRQPLNGVLVALSVKDLAAGRSGGLDHAAAVRTRLAELETSLGVRLPVYLLLTKADLIAGFSEFMGEMGERERAQVWGVTLPHRPGEAVPLDLAAIERGLGGLVERLDRRTPARLASERDLAGRALAFGFPAQIMGLAPEILRFVEAAFGSSSYETQPVLRGVYFTSATQTGTPVDRLLGAIAQSLGLPHEPPPALAGDRSFFLTTLLKDVVFTEASLVGRDLGRERREQLWRTGAVAAMALLLVATTAGWIWSYTANRSRQLALEQSLVGWVREAAPVAKAKLVPTDATLAPALRVLEPLAQLKSANATSDPLAMRLGLSQRAVTEAQTEAAYRKALRDILLPRLTLRLEQQIRVRIEDADYLLEALKVYLMLGGEAPADADLVTAWFALDLEANEPGLARPLTPHIVALAEDLPEIDQRVALDRTLLARAQATLSRIPLAKRAFTAFLASDAATELPGWSATDHAGPNAAATLVRRSGRPLGAPVPGIFTHAGFHEVFLPVLPETARAAFAESWVLGQSLRPEASPAELARLEADMLGLYENDAIAAWEGVLRDVTLAPLSSLDQAVEATKALSGPNSPLKLLVQSIVAETRLTVPPPAPEGEAGGPDAAKLATKALGKLGSKLGKLTKLLGSRAEATPTVTTPPGAAVEAHFLYLRELVEGTGGAPPALDDATAALAALNAKLSEAALSANPAEAFARMGPTGAAQVAQAAARLPQPLAQMLGGVAEKAGSISATGIRQQLNAVWQTDVVPFCSTALAGRFPFARASAVDATLDDVQRLFASGGLIDGFVQDRLTTLVDMTRRPWRPLQGVGLAPGALSQLERAKRIGTSLFASGAFKAGFSLTPLDLDSRAASVTLDIDGQILRYDHGPPQPKGFVWPGPGGTFIVRLTFAPVGGGAPATMVKEGSWSLFRLLHEQRLVPAGQPDLFEVTLAAGGHSARFRLKAGSVDNPFDLALIGGFACPASL